MTCYSRIVQPNSGEPASDSQVVSSVREFLLSLGRFVAAANSRIAERFRICMSSRTIPLAAGRVHRDLFVLGVIRDGRSVSADVVIHIRFVRCDDCREKPMNQFTHSRLNAAH